MSPRWCRPYPGRAPAPASRRSRNRGADPAGESEQQTIIAIPRHPARMPLLPSYFPARPGSTSASRSRREPNRGAACGATGFLLVSSRRAQVSPGLTASAKRPQSEPAGGTDLAITMSTARPAIKASSNPRDAIASSPARCLADALRGHSRPPPTRIPRRCRWRRPRARHRASAAKASTRCRCESAKLAHTTPRRFMPSSISRQPAGSRSGRCRRPSRRDDQSTACGSAGSQACGVSAPLGRRGHLRLLDPFVGRALLVTNSARRGGRARQRRPVALVGRRGR